jgi:hypothetical protein
MNQEIRAAVARSSTLPPGGAEDAEFFDTLLAGPHTLATLGAALATCPHPARCQVDGQVSRDGQSEALVWCAACGAMALGDGLAPWQRPVLVLELKGAEFEALAEAKQTMGQALLIAALDDSGGPHSLAIDREVLEGAIRDVLTLTLFREIKRIDGARKVLALREAIFGGESPAVLP